jgi:DNA-binding transcriptional MerR regulator
MAAGAAVDDVSGASPGSAAPAAGQAGYRGPQVCSVVGITYRQLDYWARTGLLHPSITEARGSGSQRRYSYTDLVQLKVIKRLLDAGVSLQAARKAIDCLRSAGDDLASANLVTDERGSVLAYSGEEIIDLLRGGQTVLNIVPRGGVVSELATAITDLGLESPVATANSSETNGAGEPTGGAGAAGGAGVAGEAEAAGSPPPGRRRASSASRPAHSA